MKKLTPLIFIINVIISCSPVKKTLITEPPVSLKFLDEFDIPYNYNFRSTTVGGLSGIDYDATNNLYYLISDDRSSINPARFYTASITIKGNKIDTVQFLAVNTLMQQNGSAFQNSRQDAFHTPDPEAIRYNPKTGRLIWSSEGERVVKNDTIVLENPAIYEMNITGKIIDSFPVPSNFQMQTTEKGPRQNGVFEGLTFINNYESLLVSTEEPLYEDGPRAGLGDSSARIRIIRYNCSAKNTTGQFVYKVDPVAFPSISNSSFKINGIPDILEVDSSHILVIERSFSTGKPACTIKIYLASLNGASDVSGLASVYKAPVHEIEKKLILNMDNLGIYIDNIEGMCWGPRLSNGHRTLIFVADNNFSPDEISQVLLFEVNESF